MFPRLAPPDLVSAGERAVLLDTSAVIDGTVRRAAPAWDSCRARCAFPASFSPSSRRSPTPPTTPGGRRDAGASTCWRAFPPTTAVEVFEADYPETPAGRRQAHAAGGRRQERDRHRRLQPGEGRPGSRHRGAEPQRGCRGAAPERTCPARPSVCGSPSPARRPSRALATSTTARWSSCRAAALSSAGTVDVEVTSVLQTSAGRMIFARVVVRSLTRTRAHRPRVRRRRT